MRLTLEEVIRVCPNWERFCDLHGFCVWAVNEGGGDVQVNMTISQAHHLGILKITDSWALEPFETAYPNKEE